MDCLVCGRKLTKKQKKFCSCKCSGASRKGIYLTEAHKRKIGENHARPMLGKHFIEEHKRKMSEAQKGKTHTEEAKRKIGEANKGQIPWIKDKHHTKETKKRISEAQKGRHHTEETKRKMRLSAIKRIKSKNRKVYPNYNNQACEYFKEFDEVNETEGRYAICDSGEYLIEELGYWPDYINFDLKLIIEWDESRHYVNGKLKEKDIKRQEEIKELFPDFEFRRIIEEINKKSLTELKEVI